MVTPIKLSRLTIVSLLLFLLLVVGGLLEVTNTTNVFHHRKTTPPVTANAQTKGEHPTATQTKPNTSNSRAPQPGQDKQPNSTTNTSTVLLAPSGNFVSNHHPNLSGSPAPNTMSSNCTTSPGATCQISFTKGSITKSLEAKTTDAGGTAYWNWKLQELGLGEGSWTVKAAASLGNQSKTETDVQLLQVAQ